MTKIKVTLTRTKIEEKVVEIDVDDTAAGEIMNNLGTASVDLWAKQQAMAAPGEWTAAGPIQTTLAPDVTARVERVG
jgi:hypothetical protein